MGGGLLRTNNQQERKTKKLLGILGIGLVIGVVNVRAITSHEVTYDNQGVTENLTETLDKLYSELKEYKTSGSVTSTEMLEGSTGYAKGKLVTGSIKKKGSTTYTPGVNDQVISKGQYLNEDQVILGDNNLKSENIKSGVEIFGISGSIKDYSGKTLEATTITSDETYTYLNIPDGIYNEESKVKVRNSSLDKWSLIGAYDLMIMENIMDLPVDLSQFNEVKIIAKTASGLYSTSVITSLLDEMEVLIMVGGGFISTTYGSSIYCILSKTKIRFTVHSMIEDKVQVKGMFYVYVK